MSDTEEVVVAEEIEVEVAASAPSGGLTVEEALKGVLKKALIHDGLARGLREASKALGRREAHLAVLCDTCDEDSYVKLIEALCAEPEAKIPLIKVSDSKKLGEWAGLCVLDREGNARKVVGCSCVVVKDWGEQSIERDFLLQYFDSN
ncbi:40S ribosomal protein eS12 [Lipomyces chichibuensis]|uniref:40S ribosomal protein eS12 n=1 Tax=Lipomyces chichibuensis TaxID=1546026 RepID=UPI003343F5B8